MVAVDTSLHQRREREGTPPSPRGGRGGGARGCSHPAHGPRGAQRHGAAARTPRLAWAGQGAVPPQHSSLPETPPSPQEGDGSCGAPLNPSGCEDPPGGGCGAASITPGRTVGKGLMRNEFEKPIVKNSF